MTEPLISISHMANYKLSSHSKYIAGSLLPDGKTLLKMRISLISHWLVFPVSHDSFGLSSCPQPSFLKVQPVVDASSYVFSLMAVLNQNFATRSHYQGQMLFMSLLTPLPTHIQKNQNYCCHPSMLHLNPRFRSLGCSEVSGAKQPYTVEYLHNWVLPLPIFPVPALPLSSSPSGPIIFLKFKTVWN